MKEINEKEFYKLVYGNFEKTQLHFGENHLPVMTSTRI